MTCTHTIHMSRCPRLCPGADGTSRFCSLTTSFRAGSWCVKSALLVCSFDPGSGCCENSYIVRRSCQKLFWHLPSCLGTWPGHCPCSLPEFSLLTCPGFVWRSGLCLVLTAKFPVLSLLGCVGTASCVGKGSALSGILPAPQILH